MIRLILFSIVLISFSVHSGPLERAVNSELEFVLNKLVWTGERQRFEKYDFEARLYKTSSMDSCAILYECRALEKIYVVTTEADGEEAPVMSIYQLPEAHKWEVLNWDESEPEITLKSINYRKDGSEITRKYLLKLTYISATIEDL
ncbi:hypothetical protein [Pleionea litopenaei]|uniref:Uncharacterized protein n=1 Tax=Pleionea litopenaei TaxID=3070815 RepID=A0AA51RWX5_9GAMM|nr:hypothetical protein [Pleionea sp. HL-JVS1]WMS89015.1 hypothetical protein Q9312_08885 [Pleionea sp. HL-JVS1]